MQEREEDAGVSLAFKREVLEIAKNIAEVMVEVHDKKVIHGDLKPANLLRDANGRLKLADFGSATTVDGEKEVKIGTAR